MEVSGLTPGKEYKFRVSAINSEGESEPLVAEETIIAKNPFGNIFLVKFEILLYIYCNKMKPIFLIINFETFKFD